MPKVQANNYASFYDDARLSWSLRFDTEQTVIDFAKQVNRDNFFLTCILLGGGGGGLGCILDLQSYFCLVLA